MKHIPEDILKLLNFEHRKHSGPHWGDDWNGELANDTIPKVLINITQLPQQCTDCSKTVTDRQTILRRVHTPWPHWREHCVNCKLYRHPITKEYCLTYSELNTYVREKERLNKQALKEKKDK